MTSSFDLEYHSRGIQAGKLTGVAMKEYLERNIAQMTIDEIRAAVGVLEDAEKSASYHSEQLAKVETELKETEAQEVSDKA